MSGTQKSRYAQLQHDARQVGLYVDKYSPGDNMRYRFFTEPIDYFGGSGIYTALGIKEAEVFLCGYVQAKWRGFEEGKKWAETRQGTMISDPIQGAIMGHVKDADNATWPDIGSGRITGISLGSEEA